MSVPGVMSGIFLDWTFLERKVQQKNLWMKFESEVNSDSNFV